MDCKFQQKQILQNEKNVCLFSGFLGVSLKEIYIKTLQNFMTAIGCFFVAKRFGKMEKEGV